MTLVLFGLQQQRGKVQPGRYQARINGHGKTIYVVEQLKKIATNTTSPARLGLCRSFGRNNTVVSLFPGWCIVFRTSIKAA